MEHIRTLYDALRLLDLNGYTMRLVEIDDTNDAYDLYTPEGKVLKKLNDKQIIRFANKHLAECLDVV